MEDASHMGMSRPTGSVIESLLYELCVGLGYCLPPADQERLRESPPSTVDAFTDAVLMAEGLDPLINKQPRRQVRACVAKWFERDSGSDV
jgi:hypothetical protein